MKAGTELITEERKRQVEKEGFDLEHDNEHFCGEMAMAAACYCLAEDLRNNEDNRKALPILRWWKWDKSWWKPTPDNRIKELVKAGALIAAEIDRLQRWK